MGVKGLLPFVASAFEEVGLERFKGTHLAVDASGWLHRGAHVCASDLATGRSTTSFLGFSLRMITLFRKHDIELVFVFDGSELPMKANTNDARSAQREAELTKGHALLETGRTGGRVAWAFPGMWKSTTLEEL